MLNTLLTHNIGPIEEIHIDLASRLNVFTGDNGLGKSFVLDVLWFALTEAWPKEVNLKLTQGYMVRPQEGKDGTFSLVFEPNNPELSQEDSCTVKFDFNYSRQTWFKEGIQKGCNNHIVIYAMADGSFAVWDFLRMGNEIKKPSMWGVVPHHSAYVFSPQEIWDGLQDEHGQWFCNGLLRDWASWQKEKKEPFILFQKVLDSLSPEGEPIDIGELTRTSTKDSRDIPTIIMPCGQVPVVYASSGIKRALTLAYLLTWAKVENALAAKLHNTQPTKSLIFLVDELEAHLHPKWQRSIAQSLMIPNFTQEKTTQDADMNSDVQFFITTHSPLVLASLEDIFDADKDAWFDLDYDKEKHTVGIEKRPFIKQGSAAYWYTSEAFDMETDFPIKKEQLLQRISRFTEEEKTDVVEALAITRKMADILPDIDILWVRWRAYCAEKGIVL